MCLSNIFCNSRKWRHPVFNARAYLLLLTEFGGKGDRWVTIAESGRQKAVSRNRESASNKRIADNK
jgi:hypothetical protein